jgi:hypothetical protein
VRRGETAEAIAVRAERDDGGRELSNRAVLDRDPVVAGTVVHAEVAGVEVVAAEHAVTVDRVAARSSVMLSAPITMPLSGQLTRSFPASCPE